jgi:colicin import membrane protein/protein TonB
VPSPWATERPAPATPAAPSAPAASGQSLSSILGKVRRQDVAERRWGDPSGDASGDSDTAEGDQYLAQVNRALRANYVAPATIAERERLYLEANVTLWIEPDGRIVRWRQERSSGNAAFDAAVERTLKLTPRVPAPPEPMREALRRNGISLVFQARQT